MGGRHVHIGVQHVADLTYAVAVLVRGSTTRVSVAGTVASAIADVNKSSMIGNNNNYLGTLCLES